MPLVFEAVTAARVRTLTHSHAPRFFEAEYGDGRPVLTDEGRRAVAREAERVLPQPQPEGA